MNRNGMYGWIPVTTIVCATDTIYLEDPSLEIRMIFGVLLKE